MNVIRPFAGFVGFTLIELLLVISVVGILGAISTPLYVGWRADSLNAEAVRFVEQAVATGRVDAKRRATDVQFSITNGLSTLVSTNGTMTIPNGGTIVVNAPAQVQFSGALGIQQPYGVVSFGVRTGTGVFERTATVTVIPPLGKTAVTR